MVMLTRPTCLGLPDDMVNSASRPSSPRLEAHNRQRRGIGNTVIFTHCINHLADYHRSSSILVKSPPHQAAKIRIQNKNKSFSGIHCTNFQQSSQTYTQDTSAPPHTILCPTIIHHDIPPTQRGPAPPLSISLPPRPIPLPHPHTSQIPHRAAPFPCPPRVSPRLLPPPRPYRPHPGPPNNLQLQPAPHQRPHHLPRHPF